jgi:hypothetical protein
MKDRRGQCRAGEARRGGRRGRWNHYVETGLAIIVSREMVEGIENKLTARQKNRSSRVQAGTFNARMRLELRL